MVSLVKPAADPATIAAAWLAMLGSALAAAMPAEDDAPPQALDCLAALATLALAQGKSVLILVPDDDALPELSNALDLTIRPLCLVLPGADFAARIALRATLSLLKSRLSRDAEDDQSPAWQKQRRLIAARQGLWQEAQTWCTRNDRSAWPLDVAELFPARILPIAAYRALAQKSADYTILFRCDAPAELVAPAGSVLRIGQRAATPQARAVTPADETQRLAAELSQLTQNIAELELELATAQAEMGEFTHRYYEVVGRRMVELDALQAKLAHLQAAQKPDDADIQAEAQQREEQAEASARESRKFREAAAEQAPSFRPSGDIKRMFRQLAQKIHPDRATSESDRSWRTQLMSEANRAYRAGDTAALHEIASLWQEGSPSRDTAATAANQAAPASKAAALAKQVERMRRRFGEIEAELHRLFGSRLYELFLAVRHAARQGRDLLREMAEKLDENIEQLRLRVAA